jgi:hypothetical protein
VPQENGQVSLYLEEPSINQCAIQDITGLHVGVIIERFE